MTSSTRRCFIGLALGAAISANVHAQASAALDARDWKLHEAEDVHLTLCFLGDTPEERMAALRSSLPAELAHLEAPELTVRGVGHFGETSAPRVLWAGVSAAEAHRERLRVLRQAVMRALERAAIDWDSAGPFTPHVTLARPRRPSPLPAAFSMLGFEHVWHPREVVLFGSVPGAQPHYPRIESFPLARRT